MIKLCFATNNAHKIQEVAHALSDSIKLFSLKDIHCMEELPETQSTIEGNSRQKAEYVFQNYKVPCFADDSGLEVEFLNGEPGVDSAHYAGPQRSFDDNIELLLKNLQGVENRRAQFTTVITLIGVDSNIHVFEGIIRGTILHEKRGTSGFGYDPVFLPDGHQQTFAEMTLDQKNKISHRAIAASKLIAFLQTLK